MSKKALQRNCQSGMTRRRVAASFRATAVGPTLWDIAEWSDASAAKAKADQFIFRNRTGLDSGRLRALFLEAVAGWPTGGLSVLVRYSRGSEFSGACYYKSSRIFVNIGRGNTYPYRLMTYVAAAKATRFGWRREAYSLELGNAYELALFIFLHEFYHWLVKRAGRNTRQKEGMCDRFAARVLIDRHGAVLRDRDGVVVDRPSWDFQDLEGFVEKARVAGPA